MPWHEGEPTLCHNASRSGSSSPAIVGCTRILYLKKSVCERSAVGVRLCVRWRGGRSLDELIGDTGDLLETPTQIRGSAITVERFALCPGNSRARRRLVALALGPAAPAGGRERTTWDRAAVQKTRPRPDLWLICKTVRRTRFFRATATSNFSFETTK